MIIIIIIISSSITSSSSINIIIIISSSSSIINNNTNINNSGNDVMMLVLLMKVSLVVWSLMTEERPARVQDLIPRHRGAAWEETGRAREAAAEGSATDLRA